MRLASMLMGQLSEALLLKHYRARRRSRFKARFKDLFQGYARFGIRNSFTRSRSPKELYPPESLQSDKLPCSATEATSGLDVLRSAMPQGNMHDSRPLLPELSPRVIVKHHTSGDGVSARNRTQSIPFRPRAVVMRYCGQAPQGLKGEIVLVGMMRGVVFPVTSEASSLM